MSVQQFSASSYLDYGPGLISYWIEYHGAGADIVVRIGRIAETAGPSAIGAGGNDAARELPDPRRPATRMPP